jgi:hypothetical protein
MARPQIRDRGTASTYCFFLHKTIISAVKRTEFVNDMMSYIILRGCWSYIIVLNVHAPTEDTTDDVRAASMRNWNCVP